MKRLSRAELAFDRILRNLATGVWTPGSSIPATRLLAAEFKSSLTTVQAAVKKAALHGMLRVRVAHAPEVLPEASAKAGQLLARLAAKSAMHRLAVIIPDAQEGNRFYVGLIRAIVRAAQPKNIRVKVLPWPLMHQVNMVAKLTSSGYDAAMAIGFRAEYLTSLFLLHQQRFPLLTYNRKFSQLDIPSVLIDEYGAAQRIADLFFSQGHRDICLVTKEAGLGTRDDRRPVPMVKGWLDFLEVKQLLDDCTLPVYTTDFQPRLPYYGRAFERIMIGSDRPTAILFSHAISAYYFQEDPRFKALEAPAQISLATFDENTRPTTAEPHTPLTSVTVDVLRVAACAIEIAEKLIAGQLNTPSIRVPHILTTTESVGAPPQERLPLPPWRGKVPSFTID